MVLLQMMPFGFCPWNAPLTTQGITAGYVRRYTKALESKPQFGKDWNTTFALHRAVLKSMQQQGRCNVRCCLLVRSTDRHLHQSCGIKQMIAWNRPNRSLADQNQA